MMMNDTVRPVIHVVDGAMVHMMNRAVMYRVLGSWRGSHQASDKK
jgi:hypothetical protein